MSLWMQTVTAKVLGIGVLALLMMIPLLQVRGLVRERQQLRTEAISQIAKGWGGQQVLGGPVLVVPTLRQEVKDGQTTSRWQMGSESVLADALKLDVAMVVSTRGYGIYTAPVFVATVKLAAQFRAEDLANYRHTSDAAWQGAKAELRLPIGDLHGLQEI
ncbi:MAG: inner membrane CreD family protein, partial [Rhodanobacter sp.]